MKYLRVLLFPCFLLLAAVPVHAIPAFPGAEGFGAGTVGGRGGMVYEVTNLNDSGPGSLRECIQAAGPRTCVFTIGGTITLSSTLTISNPYITIAGQTAPGGGITLKKSSGGDIFQPKTHDIVIRYITGRPGPGGENHAVQSAANNSTSLYNIVFDHCSFSWGVDSVWETWYRVYDATIQWSFINEGLDCSTHSKGCHSKGLMIGGYKQGEGSTNKGSYNISVHHNLMAHNGERTPLMQFCGTGQVINNITYNPYWTFSHQQDNCIDKTVVSTVNWIGNYHKKGPDSTSNADLKVIADGAGVSRVYVRDNIGPSRTSDTQPENYWVDANSRTFIVSTPAAGPPVTSTSAHIAYDQVLAEGGNSKGINCNSTWFSRRDAIDTRVANDVKNGTGHIIDHPSEVGGWVTVAAGTPCTDTDHDGISDTWETTQFGTLSWGSATNSASDYDADGYTDLEEFFNGTNPKDGNPSSPTPSTPLPTYQIHTPTKTRTPTPLPSPTATAGKPGDANGDNLVDEADYTIWKSRYGQTVSGVANGDFNNSGKVDGVDYVVWMSHYGL